MTRYSPRAVLLLFLVLNLTACTSWQSVSLDAISPAQLIEEDRPDRVRVTTQDVLELELVSPSVEGDELVGITRIRSGGRFVPSDLSIPLVDTIKDRGHHRFPHSGGYSRVQNVGSCGKCVLPRLLL